jgi:hypothetical protein
MGIFGGRLSFLDDVDKFTLKNNAGSTANTNHNTQWSYALNIFQTRLKKILPNFYGGFRYSSGLGYSITTSKNNNEQTSIFTQPASTVTTSSIKQNSIAANVGITSQFYYFITPQWGLSANIGYLDATFSHNFKAKTWSFNTYSSFNGFGLGLFKILHQ